MSCLTGPPGADPWDRKGNPIMTNQLQNFGGVDSYRDTIHIAVITSIGQPVADQESPTTTAGYWRAVAWLIEHGPLRAVGIEGTSSYGVGIATAVIAAGRRLACRTVRTVRRSGNQPQKGQYRTVTRAEHRAPFSRQTQ